MQRVLVASHCLLGWHLWHTMTGQLMRVVDACSKRTSAALPARLLATAALPPRPPGTLWRSLAMRLGTGPLPQGPPGLPWPASPPSTAPPWSPPAADSMGTRAALQTTRARPPAALAAAAPAPAVAALHHTRRPPAPHPTRPPPATPLASRSWVDDRPWMTGCSAACMPAVHQAQARVSDCAGPPCPVGEE